MDNLIYPEIYSQAETDLFQDLEDAADETPSLFGGQRQQTQTSQIYNLNEILDSLDLDGKS